MGESRHQAESLLYQDSGMNCLCQLVFANNLIYWVSSLRWKMVALGLVKTQMMFSEAVGASILELSRLGQVAQLSVADSGAG